MAGHYQRTNRHHHRLWQTGLGLAVMGLGLSACGGAPPSAPSASAPATDAAANRPAATSSAPSDAASVPPSSAPGAVPSDLSEVAAAAETPTTDELWTLLQRQDAPYFVLMRHAIAPGTGDPANFQLEDCTTQRNLSAEGRSQAVRTGDAFRQRDIAVSQVLSSQWCRCLETATLLDLGPVEPFPALNSFFRDRSTAPQQTAAVETFLRDQDTPGVTVLVTHFVNIAALTDTSISSGAMVVMRLNDQNQLEVLGQLEPF